MAFGDIRDEWKLNEIERKADAATRRLYEIDTLNSNVARLESSNRELRSVVDGLRSELERCKSEITQQIADIQAVLKATSSMVG